MTNKLFLRLSKNKLNIVSILFFFIALNIGSINAQLPFFENEQIQVLLKKTKSIDKSVEDIIEEKEIIFDSINTSSKIWENKIETYNMFKISSTSLKISMYIDSGEIIVAKVKEESKRLKDLASKNTEYYFVKADSCLIFQYYRRPTSIALLPGDENDFYDYNETINDEFLRKFINELYKKLATTQK